MSAFGISTRSIDVQIFPQDISKSKALDLLIDDVCSSNVVENCEEFRRAVYERESIMSTGIGSGIAIPHVRLDEIQEPRLGIGISRNGIDFDTLDKQPVHITVLFAMPESQHREYLGILAQVMVSLKTPGLQEKLRACKTSEEALVILKRQ